MNGRAIIYARVSSDLQRDNNSIPTQIADCISYIGKRGYALVGDHFVDPVTGFDATKGNGSIAAYVDDFTSLELNRPSLDAAFTYLESVGIDIVVVHALDRLARDPYFRQTLENEFTRKGARVEYVLGNYEASPEGEVRKDMDATFAKWENAKRVERCNRGKRGKAERGRFVGVGHASYGYSIDPEIPGGLSIDEGEAGIVKQIFYWYVHENQSLRGIAKKLNDMGVATPYGKASWFGSTVKLILANTAYIGDAYYNKTKRGNGRVNPRDKLEWVKIAVPPIIDSKVFNEAQRKRKINKDAYKRKPQRFYMLSRMIRCLDCGKPYISQYRKPGLWRNGRIVYRHKQNEGHCINREITGSRIEAAVWERIKKFLLEPGSLHEGYEQALEKERNTQRRQRVLLEKYHRSIGKLEQRKTNLIRAYTDPEIGMTKAEFLSERDQIDGEMQSVAERMQEIESQLSELPTREELESLEHFAGEVRMRLASQDWQPTDENKRKVLEMLHVQVFVGLDYTGKITGWFGELDGLLYRTS